MNSAATHAGEMTLPSGPSDHHPVSDNAVTTCDIRFGSTNTRTLNVHGSGRPIILLHPFGVAADAWEPVLSLLGRYGNNALAPDLIGSGRADGFEDGPLLPQLDEFVAAVVAAYRNAGPVILVGASHSAVLALRAAAAAPADVDAVIVVGIPHGGWPINRFRAAATPSSAPRPPKALRRELHRLNSDECIPAVKCPSLIIQGLRGTSGAISGGRRLQESLPNSRLVLLPRCGSFAHRDNPMRIAGYAREMATMVRHGTLQASYG